MKPRMIQHIEMIHIITVTDNFYSEKTQFQRSHKTNKNMDCFNIVGKFCVFTKNVFEGLMGIFNTKSYSQKNIYTYALRSSLRFVKVPI